MNAHRQSNHAAAVDKMAEIFPSYEVRGWIVVHTQDDGDFSVETRGEGSRTRFVDSNALLRELGDWLTPLGNALDLFVVADILEHRNW